MEEVFLYANKAKTENYDSRYEKAKSIVKTYNDQDDYKLVLIS